MVKSLGEYSDSIKNQIHEEQAKSKDFVNIISGTINSVRDGLFKELQNYEERSKQRLAKIKEVMLHSNNTKMPKLTNFLFDNEDEYMDEYKDRENREKDNNQYLDHMYKVLDGGISEEQKQY